MKNDIRCFLLDHKLTDDYNDSGYRICHRCGFHEYYDYPEPIYCKGGILKFPFRFVKSVFVEIRRIVSKAYYTHIAKDKLPF